MTVKGARCAGSQAGGGVARMLRDGTNFIPCRTAPAVAGGEEGGKESNKLRAAYHQSPDPRVIRFILEDEYPTEAPLVLSTIQQKSVEFAVRTPGKQLFEQGGSNPRSQSRPFID